VLNPPLARPHDAPSHARETYRPSSASANHQPHPSDRANLVRHARRLRPLQGACRHARGAAATGGTIHTRAQALLCTRARHLPRPLIYIQPATCFRFTLCPLTSSALAMRNLDFCLAIPSSPRRAYYPRLRPSPMTRARKHGPFRPIPQYIWPARVSQLQARRHRAQPPYRPATPLSHPCPLACVLGYPRWLRSTTAGTHKPLCATRAGQA
jgi:hypothetical protein